MADKLTPMALKKSEAKELFTPKSTDGPKYPWGLCITLDRASLDKLKVTELPKVGTYMTVTAYCCVSSVSESQQMDGDENRSLGLQIESMKLTPDAPKMRGSAKRAKGDAEEYTESKAEAKAETPASERAEKKHTAKRGST